MDQFSQMVVDNINANSNKANNLEYRLNQLENRLNEIEKLLKKLSNKK